MIIAMVKIHSWKISGEKSYLQCYFFYCEAILYRLLSYSVFVSSFCLFIYFWTMKRVGSSSPGRGLNPGPLWWQEIAREVLLFSFRAMLLVAHTESNRLE